MGISMAFSLLFIGMITVFAVLALVYLSGNLLIRFVNTLDTAPVDGQDKIEKSKVAAINAAIEIFTQGTGKVTKITKRN